MQILIAPVITEKSLGQVKAGVYVFEVARCANKASIARAVEDLYKVDVTAVRVTRVKGKKKMIRGRFEAQQKNWKKAVITIKKGQKIPGYEQ